MKIRDRVMGNIGSLLDNMEDLLARLERQERNNNVDETDQAFMEGLEHIRPEIVKFYRYWEERY